MNQITQPEDAVSAPLITNLELEQNYRAWQIRTTVSSVFCIFATEIAKGIGWVSNISAFFLIFLVVLLLGYWIPPRPPIRYRYFLIKSVGYLAIVYLGMLTAPELLSRVIWTPLAYGLPALATFLAALLLPPLHPRKRTTPVWLRVILSIAMALVFGLVVPRLE
jgi:hypothetical protein